jgi:hypothetical protein
MSFDIDPGSQFPDLRKAGLNKKLEDIVKGLIDSDQEVFQLAQDTKVDLYKQKDIDLKSFWESQSGAIERGNTNACTTKNLIDRSRENQAGKVEPIILVNPNTYRPYGTGRKQTKLPKTHTVGPVKGNLSRPPSMTRFVHNQLLPPAIDPNSHVIDTIEPNNYPEKAARNMRQFAKAQAGERGTSIGDRAIVFTASGTPMYGDSYLDRNSAENLAANQATSNLPLTSIPRKIETNRPTSAAGLQQQPRANITPKGNTAGNLLILGAIGAAVTAVLFFFQHILIFVQMILQISSVTSTITNIAGSFVSILNSTGSFFGLGEGLVTPISDTFDSILNNVFGKDKVDYVKYQFAKISGAFVAGQNLINKVSGLNNTVGKVTETNANNTSIIGNAMKAMGMINGDIPWMNEKNKVNVSSGLGQQLDKISGLANSLSEITNDVKSFVDEQKSLDKQQEEREKSDKDGQDKAKETNTDESIPEIEILGGSN